MAEIITDADDELEVLGVLLGLFENGTGLSEAQLYDRLVELQRGDDDAE